MNDRAASVPPIGREHPLRRELAEEIHARPYVRLEPPLRVAHLAMLSGEAGANKDRAHVADLCRRFGATEPADGATQHLADLGPCRLRWERHTEFSTYTVIADGTGGAPFADPPVRLLPADWLAALPGGLLVALKVCVEAADAPARDIWATADLFDGNTITGSRVLKGRARVWTDHRLDSDGFQRLLVRDDGLDARRAGRLVQRLLEMETYRMLAMLAFPVAKNALGKVRNVEARLNDLVSVMPRSTEGPDERELLARLSELAVETESIVAASSYRLAATRAYHKIVARRLRELEEERLEPLQMSGDFMTRRLAPAMETCETVTARLESLSRRIGRAGDLLRTRVDISLEEQNRDLLASMDRRARLQVRLQQTVEGLSAVAVSYYLLGLVSYLAKGLAKTGVPMKPDLVVMIAVPVVLIVVWQGIRRIRKAITAERET